MSLELVRLYHAPALDAFRATLAGRLLLGTHFVIADTAAYWAGIAIFAWIDFVATQRR